MDHIELWDLAKKTLSEGLVPASFEMWIDKPLTPVYLAESELGLEYISDYYRTNVEQRYLGRIESALAKAAGRRITIRWMSTDERRAWQEEQRKKAEMLIPGSNMFSPRFTFDSFIVGTSNRFAHAAALAVAQQPGRAYNPLFIHGGVGLGKTHLMHAIGHFVQDNYPQMRLLYLTTEMFTNELITAIRTNNNNDFRNRFRSVDVLMLDDIQFIAGRDSTQEEFFHTFNALHAAGKQIIISSDKPPRDIARLEERLRTRFEWGLIADIQQPDFDTRMAILRKKADSEHLSIDDSVLIAIAEKVQSNIRELEGALNRVSAYAKLTGGELNCALVDESLRSFISEKTARDPKRITVDLIIDEVASYYNLSPELLRGSSRKKDIATARHIAVYLTRELTGLSLPRIGAAFDRDHTTIINSCEKVTSMIESSQPIKDAVMDLKKIIEEK